MKESSQRHLAAILFADVVGFTSMMQRDENDCLSRLARYQEVLSEYVTRYRGEIFQSYGDGSLCMFNSSVDAIACAGDIQVQLRQEPVVPVRIGIHMGDIVRKEQTIYGDAVNLASRVESLGVPHAVLFTERVASDLRNHPEFTMQNLGSFLFKNVNQKMDVYALTGNGLSVPLRRDMKGKLSEKKISWQQVILLAVLLTAVVYALLRTGIWPAGGRADLDTAGKMAEASIAVIPFANLNSDKDNDFFSDGITEEILLRLQKMRNLRTISRTSVMHYRTDPKPIPDIGRELNVTYVLEGSVRSADEQFVINASLIKADITEKKIWSEIFRGKLTTKNIFDVQQQIANMIGKALQAKVSPEIVNSGNELPTKNHEAYSYYLRGNYFYHRQVPYSDINTRKALENYEKAVKLDNGFALAYIKVAACNRFLYWFNFDRTKERALEARANLGQALLIEPNLPEARIEQAWQYYHFDSQYDKAITILEDLRSVYPNYDEILWALSNTLKRKGDFDEASKRAEDLVELNPRSPLILLDAAHICEYKNDFAKAESYYDQWLNLEPDEPYVYALKARLAMLWKWDLKGAIRSLVEANVRHDAIYDYMLNLLYLRNAQYKEALKILDASTDEIFLKDQSELIPKDLAYARVYFAQSNHAKQLSAAKRCIEYVEGKLSVAPDDFKIHAALALAYAYADDQQRSVAHAKESMRLLPVTADAIIGPQIQTVMLDVYIINKQYRQARQQLEFIRLRPSLLTSAILENDPFYLSLRN